MLQIFNEEIKARLKKEGLCYLKVRIVPKSPQNLIVEKMTDDSWKIRVAAPAEKSKANRELIAFLAKTLKISREKISIISGGKDRGKLLKIAL